MIVLISLSLIIPFLMILSAQKRNYESELDRILTDCDSDVIKSHRKAHELNHENFELRAKLEIQELKVMHSCRNWSKMAQLKCAINPTGSCLDCHNYEVLGK